MKNDIYTLKNPRIIEENKSASYTHMEREVTENMKKRFSRKPWYLVAEENMKKLREGELSMSEMKCYLCERTVKRTKKCNKLFGRDICPECSSKAVSLISRFLIDDEIRKEHFHED